MQWSRLLLALLLCPSALGQTQKAPSAPPKAPPPHTGATASVQGAVVNSLNGKPLDHVHVMLVGYGADNFPALIYGAMTDATGHFSILRVPGDGYLIMLERMGFVYVPRTKGLGANGALKLQAGDQLTDLILEMVPRALITGRVVDEYGDPVMNASVIVQPLKPEAMPRFRPQATTNDRGEFRTVVAPGKYRLMTYVWPAHELSPSEIRSDGSTDARYVQTYYPSTADKDTATIIEAKAGSEISGVEIRLVRTAVLSISGVISGLPGNVSGLSVHTESGPDPTNLNNNTSRQWGPGFDGKVESKFELGNLGAGFYRVYARCNAAGREMQSQIVEINLTDSNVEGVNLELAPGVDISGTIQMPGKPEPASQQLGRTVRLQPVGSQTYDRILNADVASDGTFTVEDVFAGRYRVLISPLPENDFIKEVRLNGTPAPGGVLDFSSGAEGAGLKITISPNAAEISGKVENAKEDAGIPFAVVLLCPDQENVSPEECRAKPVSPSGTYGFKGLAPGQYKLAVMTQFDGAIAGIPDVFKHREQAEKIDIKEGDKLQKDLKFAPREEKENGQQD